MSKVGFVGLGIMGTPMAGQLLAGGHELFVMGAHDSRGGKSVICLHSTARVADATISTIVASLPLGTRVTTPRHHVQYVVTEYGAANLGMLTDVGRMDALIAIAHPDFREELRAAAREFN